MGGMRGTEADSRLRHKTALSKRRFTQFLMMEAGIYGLRRLTASPDANAMKWLEQARREAVHTGWNLGPRMGCTAGRRRRTVILQRGARATGNCGLPRRGGWWKWTR